MADQPQGNVASGDTDSGNPVKVGGVVDATPSASVLLDGQRSNLRVNPNGMLYIAAGDYGGGAGSDARGLTGISNRVGAGTVPMPVAVGSFALNGATWDRVTKPNSTSRLLSAAASTNATSVKASAGNLHRIRGENTNAARRYLKLYNKASAPTVGTDTPVLTYVLAASAQFDIDVSGAGGHYFSAGIAYALTTAAADADTGALTAGDVACMNITYS